MEQTAHLPVVYFDHAAAAPVEPALLAHLPELAARAFANPEAGHRLAYEMREAVKLAGKRLAQQLFFRPPSAAEAVFGASASDLAARLSQLEWHGGEAGSALDHPAIRAMRRRAFAAHGDLAADSKGDFQLPARVSPETALVTVPWVQSETGLMTDADKLIPALRTQFPQALILLDMVQGAGKLAPLRALPDLALISGHKFGAPGGAALLLLTEQAQKLAAPLRALRQRDYLTGRDDPLAILGMTETLEIVNRNREENWRKLRQLSDFLRAGLAALRSGEAPAVRFLFAAERVSPYILHFLLPGRDTGVIVRMLAERNIMAAAGSACRSESGEPSAVLRSLGLSREMAYSGLRLSFGPRSTMDEAQYFLKVLPEVLQNY